MKKPRIIDAMEHIDEDLITDAVSYKPKRNRISGVSKWIAATACLCLVIGIGLPFIQMNVSDQDKDGLLPLEVVAELNDKLYSIVTNPKSDAFDNYNLEKEITPDLIGEELGTQELVIQNDENGAVTDLFTLYRYAKAPVTKYNWYPRIIVKDSEGNFYHAIIGSSFEADTQTPDEVLDVYGLNSPEDIQAVKQRKGYGNKRITDNDFIQEFYQGLITDNWGDNDFLQKNVYQNTGLDEQDLIDKLYPKYADDSVFLVVELKNGMCLDIHFSSHHYVEVFHDLYFKVDDDWLALVSKFK